LWSLKGKPEASMSGNGLLAGLVGISARRVLEMARKGEIPAHPIGELRKTWRFRISEIDAHFGHQNQKQAPATIRLAVPVTRQMRKLG
jgi:hypothetical protein